jgi:ADP-ribose pyrophosphatase YjhB (NUDIX family)
MTGIAEQRIRCVGAVIFDDAGRLLMVRRAHEPGRGRWSVPGGRVHPGETDAQAVIREVAEETGLVVEMVRLLGSVQRHASETTVFDIYDYCCRVTGGTLRAGDDADDARWCDRHLLSTLPVVAGLIEALTAWHCLSPSPDMETYRGIATPENPDMSPYRGSGGSSGGSGAGAHG